MRRQVGAILVKEKRILSTGYNGAPSGVDHCLDVGCLREQKNIPSGERHELCRGSHAEQNAIVQAAAYGTSVKEAVLFCTNLPCSICIKMIINAGIKVIFYEEGYPDSLSEKLMKEAGIALTNVKKSVE
jgi:dCMP deaminase